MTLLLINACILAGTIGDYMQSKRISLLEDSYEAHLLSDGGMTEEEAETLEYLLIELHGEERINEILEKKQLEDANSNTENGDKYE